MIHFLSQQIEKIKVFLMIRILWKIFPQKKVETLRLFEATEDDSSWQLLYALKQTEDAKSKVELFKQAMEEAHHAELFREVYGQETQQKMNRLQYQKNLLYRRKEDAWKLFVYCLIGEADAADRFQVIAKNLPQGPFKKTLKKIIADEEGHIELARELIKVDGKSEAQVNKVFNSIKRQRFYESWLRHGRQVTNAVTDILLTMVYMLVLPPFALLNSLRGRKVKKFKVNLETAGLTTTTATATTAPTPQRSSV